MRVVTSGLDGPWELAWGPDQHLWVTERKGRRILRINPADGTKSTVRVLPEVHQSVTQDGLLGMALDPELLRGTGRDFVYVAFTYDDAPGPELVRRLGIRRYQYDSSAGVLRNPVEVILGLPAHDDHVAGRLVQGPDLKLYLSVGDQGSNFGQNRCNANHAQDLPTDRGGERRDSSKYQARSCASRSTVRSRDNHSSTASAVTCSPTVTAIQLGLVFDRRLFTNRSKGQVQMTR